MSASEPSRGGTRDPGDPWVSLPPPYTSREFSRFLETRRVSVLDFVPGAAWGTRRLLVGDRGTGDARYAAAVSPPSVGSDPTAREEFALTHVRPELSEALRETLPQVVEHVGVFTNFTGLVVTGVPGLRPPGLRPPPPPVRNILTAADAWLTAVQDQTAGPAIQVDLGAAAIDVLLGRYAGTAQLEPALQLLRSARQRMSEHEITSTLSHGCLCLRHAMFEAGEIVGVDDWGLSSPSGDPLRDVGEFAVRISGSRLPEVLAGASSYASTLRQFSGVALARLGLPRRLWRELLLLAQLELATTALERDDHDGMVLLARAVAAVPRHRN
jgi:hypothetical protein